MQRRKRSAALFLVAALMTVMFAGCGGSKDGKELSGPTDETKLKAEGAGRFLESEVELPKEVNQILSLRMLDDGTLAMVGRNQSEKRYYVLKSRDLGEKWEKQEITGTSGQFLFRAAIAPDGAVVLIAYAKDGTVKGKSVNPKGKIKNISFRLPGTDRDGQVNQMAFDAAGNLFISDVSGSLLSVSLADGTCRTVDTKGVRVEYFYVAGNIITAVHSDGIMLFDTETKKGLGAESVLDDIVKSDKKLAWVNSDAGTPLIFSGGAEPGRFVYTNEDGIYHFKRGGSVAERLVDGSLTSLSGGNILFLAQTFVDEKHIMLAVSDEEQDRLLLYSYDENASSVPKQELTIYALDESNVLRKAVTAYHKKHPDVYVKLEIGMKGNDGVTLEDALSVLNTNILAKKGPDVLILDGMPVESYIEKGVLADLSDVVEQVDKEEGIFANIREGSKKNGKIYAMPVRILLPVAEGDAKVVEAAGSLEKLAKHAASLGKSGKGQITPQKGTKTLLRDFYYADSARWLNGDGSLNQQALTECLANAKKLYDVDADKKGEDYMDKLWGDGTWDGSKVGSHTSAGLLTGELKMAFGSVAGLYDIQTMCSERKQTKADYCLLNHEKVKSYIPSLMAGVTTGGHTKEAKEFVKELLGKKSGGVKDGFPVNRTAYKKACKEKMDDPGVKEGLCVAISGPGEDAKSYGYKFVNLKQSDVDKLTEIMESLEKPAMTDRVIQELVLAQGDKYLRGEQTLDVTVDTIMKKVNLYLAE